MTLVITGYCRDYKTSKEAQAAWHQGKDFVIRNANYWIGAPCSIRDIDRLKEDGFTEVQIRFNRRTDLVIVPL